MSSEYPPATVQTWGRPRFTAPQWAELARSQGDAAAWQAAFDEAGVLAPTRVEGGFAVGIVDQVGRAFLAVDRFAEHSLCYRIEEGSLRFAARADTLADAGLDAIDPQAIFDYLYFHCIPSPRTIFRNVHRVPPGHYVRFENGRLETGPYWQPRFDEAPRGDFDSLRDDFRALLRDAVARCLDGGKAACYLSGGTDSSTVAGLIGEVMGRPAATYSIGFEAQGYDEMSYARVAAQHFGTEHHEYYVTPADLVASIPAVARHYDQPFGNSSALPAYYCARMARNDGVSRLLAGDGGDELFGGNARYAKQRVFGWYEHVPMPLRKGIVEPILLQTPAGRVPLVRKVASYVDQARDEMPNRLQQYNLLLRLGVDQVLTPDFLASIDMAAPLQHQRAVWHAVKEPASDLNHMLAYDWRYTLAESDLPKVRGSAALAGMDVAFPMLDDGLLDFSLRLPVSYKLRGLKLRWFFKEALRGFLPDEILTKKKQGFGLPFGVWAMQHDALYRLAQASLHSFATRGIVRADFIEALLQTHLKAHPAYYGEMIWILMMLEQWLQSREGA
ncbi:asparagine synthase-related protein [Aquincola sp. MAHUQ-54]|uniref:asparagine synthase (glutamine-hydrolyzing) n=1 Tax=Aquincola agrisoli TaxID=3119538 RepID=A0AAW9QHX7_9BURK